MIGDLQNRKAKNNVIFMNFVKNSDFHRKNFAF